MGRHLSEVKKVPCKIVRGYVSLSNCEIWLSESSWLLKILYNSASLSIRCCRERAL